MEMKQTNGQSDEQMRIKCSFHAPLQTQNKLIPRNLLHALHSKCDASENKMELLLNLR
jgi:hypothetical protein